MIPATSSVAIWLILLETRRMNPVEIRAPMKAAAIRTYDDAYDRFDANTIIVKATTILAPDDIPSTKGPAIGLLKKVCSRKPARDRAPPRTAAIRILGILIVHIILTSSSRPCPVKSTPSIRFTGICTLPMLIFSIVITIKATARTMKTIVYLALLLIFADLKSSFIIADII